VRTPTWLAAATAAVSAAVLPACDVVNLQELKAGVSTAAEVRVRMGLPIAEHANADGTVTYEYNRQPNGTECFMITIGTDQIVQRIEQVLTERNMAKVVAGMDKGRFGVCSESLAPLPPTETRTKKFGIGASPGRFRPRKPISTCISTRAAAWSTAPAGASRSAASVLS